MSLTKNIREQKTMSKKDGLKQLNRILAALPESEYQRFAPYLTPVDMALEIVLYEPQEQIETVYFPVSALISIASTLEDGTTTEIGLIGSNGIVGLPVILGSGRSSNNIVVQVAGMAIKLSAEILKKEFERGEMLQKLLLSYTEARLIQVSQQAVCNRHHPLEEKLARWMLTVADSLSSKEFSLTQKFIANMLGVRRSSVTVAIDTLQSAGMIRSSQDKITILDRESLENTSCECYFFLKQEFQSLLG